LTSCSVCAPDLARKCCNYAFIHHADCQLQSRRVNNSITFEAFSAKPPPVGAVTLVEAFDRPVAKPDT
jgi:hypothetical protein